jgi:hypothetical protein
MISDVFNRLFLTSYSGSGLVILCCSLASEEQKYYGYWGCPFQALGELYSRMVVSDQRRKVLENYLKSAQIENERGWTQYRAAQECYNYGDYPEALTDTVDMFTSFKEKHSENLINGLYMPSQVHLR